MPEELSGRRARLLREARRIFAAKGFDKASTREIASAAEANIGLIAYYFGDKQGLYREVLVQPIKDVMAGMPDADASLPLQQWLQSFYGAFLRPLYDADSGLSESTRIFCREMIAPSPIWADICAEHIAPQHFALVDMLAQRCGASAVDPELHQLAFALVALAHDYWLSADDMEGLLPGVVRGPGAYERTLNRLVTFGRALIEAEGLLRKSR
ncbi:CerR family C-terminal domain-containing protein [Roseateles oligotrophus]|uniref:CerR family C-terminal domain-containing protein n=1 Tax=Roseateles oligotrophus TaxID=1769250 RepID=A0ABT2YGI9_9BURK|nr:CerR family C-terminal domain-containing protein [Roseateles oligotrophus]MCV2369150.1 CerR family C-terminal domain-containing protein [Roseateles oligotrophus]